MIELLAQKRLVLASASPRRKSLLAQLGVNFEVVSADIDETVLSAEEPSDYVSRLALEKCEKVFDELPKGHVVIGSDTSVVVDQQILGKPQCKEDAVSMLMQLSGRWHQVLTAVAIKDENKTRQIIVGAEVEFCTLTEDDCLKYWHTKEPQDKAGSYAIQGIGARFVKQIKGSNSAIVGLPVSQVADLLDEFGVEYWQF
jgi:septum formation protein